MEGISIVDRGEVVTTREKRDRGDSVGNSGLLGGGVCSGSQSLACSVGGRRWEVHPGVVILDGKVSRDEERDVKVAVDVKEGEFMLCNE